VVVQNQELKDTLVEHSWGQQHISNCSDLLVLSRKKDFSDKNVEDYIADIVKTRWGSKEDVLWYENMMKWTLAQMDEKQKNVWMDKQIYIALWNVMTVCASMSIDACPVEWFVAEKYDEILGLTEKWLSSVVVLPIWYRDDSDKYSQLEKVRFPTSEILEMM
jgi:nitroreductase/dihydropteridine reductase